MKKFLTGTDFGVRGRSEQPSRRRWGPMYWYRLEVSLGRNGIVGTTVRQEEVPEHLLADEHHQTLDGNKVYVATTVAEGCCLGASININRPISG